MLGSRLTPWIIVVGLCACTSDGNRMQGAGPADTTTTGRGATTTAAATTTGTGGSAGAAGAPVDAGGTGGTSPTDAAAREAGMEIHDDANTTPVPCANNRATLGSRLRAGGATPAAFVEAYNVELDALLGPGPFLMVFLGVNDAAQANWIGAFGALDPGDAGTGVGFAESHAEVRFTMGAARSIQVSATDASFGLRFSSAAATVPVVSVELSGTLTQGCGSLAMTKAKLLVPATAGSISFHGSTLAALMGAPTVTWRGQAASAWLLELAGTAKQVYAPGVLEDGGAE